MRLNKKSLLLIFVIYGLILAALITRDGDLLLIAIPMIVFLIVGLLQAPTGLDLHVERVLDRTSAVSQQPVEVRIIIKNNGKDLANLYIKDQIFPAMTIIEGQPERQLALPSGSETSFDYSFSAPRTIFSWQNIYASASDPLGLLDFESDIPVPGEVLVKPAPVHIRPVTLKPHSTLHTAGPIPARIAGAGTDFWGVREYRPGDSFRWINWRLTNRHPHKMFTNEYEREEVADYGIILDASRLSDSQALEEEIFEHSVSAVASLSEIFLRTGNRVSLLVLGRHILQVFPGYGKGHLNTLLVNLSRAELGGNTKFRNLEYFPTQLFPPRSMLLVFSLVGLYDLRAYSRMKAYGYDVLLISPNLVAQAAQTSPQTEINSLAYRAARIERTLQLQQIRKLGITVVDWQVNKPVDLVVRQAAQAVLHRRKY